MCGIDGATPGKVPTTTPATDVAPPKGGGDSTGIAGAKGGGPAGATGFSSLVDQIMQVEHTLEDLIKQLQGGAVAGAEGGGPKGGAMPGCDMPGMPPKVGLPDQMSPVQQTGPIQGGGPAIRTASAGLLNFVQQGESTLQQMTSKAQANANANGGNFSQTDIVTIQQRRTQVDTARALASFLQKHPAADADPETKRLTAQALGNANANGGNFSVHDLAAVKLRVAELEGSVNASVAQGLLKVTSPLDERMDTIKQMTAKALANANANGGNFSQTDLATIQQHQQVTTQLNDLVAKVVEQAAKVTPAQVTQVQQAVQTSNVAQLQQVVQQLG
jgi:hypothetical protein